MSKIRITSGGTSDSTRVYCDGVEITCIKSIKLDLIEGGGLVTAAISFCDVALDIEATRTEE